jgi:RNA polymerase sigma-70 factor (ECF subfamily)
MTEAKPNAAFEVQGDVRGPWRRYLDALAPIRPQLHRYCCRLTGNVWDGEDLMQDTLLRMFGLLGKIDRNLENPRAYFIRTATHLWIDQQRRLARDRAWRAQQELDDSTSANVAEQDAGLQQAARELLHRLPPRERAAVLMREVLDLSAREAAAFLQISEGAVKAALHRARDRLQADSAARPVAIGPSRQLVEKFLDAMASNDMATMQAICSTDIAVELVGGARSDNFEDSSNFFGHAHWVPTPELQAIARAMKLGTNPHWKLEQYRGEWLVLGFRTWEGVEGLNEIHRLEEEDGKITRIRCYCFCPDTLKAIGDDLGIPALPRPYRSPDPPKWG